MPTEPHSVMSWALVFWRARVEGRLRRMVSHVCQIMARRSCIAIAVRVGVDGLRPPFAFPFILAVSRPANLGASILPRN